MTTQASLEGPHTNGMPARAKAADDDAHDALASAPRDTSKPRGRILVADDEPTSRSGLATLLRSEGFVVDLASDGHEALARLAETAPDVLITDLRMPGIDGIELLRRARELYPEIVVVVMTAALGVDSAVRATREGAADYLLKPLEFDNLFLVLERALERRDLRREATALRARLEERTRFENIVGTSAPMQHVLETIERVAKSRASVLITGEHGTGKELVAEALHEHGPRASAPFVKLHCGALAESLLESELFGHEKGAFTGARARREGRFQQADGGTLFLNEIGAISPSLQVKLLRLLQERTFERVGGNEPIKVDVRIIAATDRDLRADVTAGSFREDLFCRLNVVSIEMPPLRVRPGDVMPLAIHFLERFAHDRGKKIDGFDEAATEQIMSYRWPGNVEELENVVERAVSMCEEPLVCSKHLPASVATSARGAAQVPGSTLDEIERHAILATLEAVGGSTAQAARMLGVSIRKIQYKLHEYGVAMNRAPEPRHE